MGFIIELALKDFKRHPIRYVITIVSLTLGSMVAAMFICQLSYEYVQLQENIAIFNDRITYFIEPELSEDRAYLNDMLQLSDRTQWIDEFYFLNRYEEYSIFTGKEFIVDAKVFMASYTMEKILNTKYLEGKWISKDDECVIGEKNANKYNLHMGDYIEAGVNKYEVVGVLNGSELTESIILPYTWNEDVSFMLEKYFVVVDKVEDDDFEEGLKNVLRKYTIEDFSQHVENIRSKLYRGWGPSVIISLISIIYGVINMRCLDLFYLEKDRKKFAVMSACGSRKSGIYCINIIRAFVLTFISGGIVLISMYGISRRESIFHIDISVNFMSALIFSALILSVSVINSITLTRRIFKRNIAELLKEGRC